MLHKMTRMCPSAVCIDTALEPLAQKSVSSSPEKLIVRNDAR